MQLRILDAEAMILKPCKNAKNTDLKIVKCHNGLAPSTSKHLAGYKRAKAIRRHDSTFFFDLHYKHALTYRNGAESYYAAKGFRESLRVLPLVALFTPLDRYTEHEPI